MSKNNMGKVLAFLAGAGAAAAAIAYFVRYKAFNKELEKDFHAFEDEELDDGDEEDPLEDLNNPSHRNYVSLSSSKDEFKAAAKDVKESVGAAASAAKDVLKDTAAVLKDTAYELSLIHILICGTPIPAITRVVQIEPGPIPTLTASTPASISALVASPVATFPAITGRSGNASFNILTQRITLAECP